MSEKRKQIDRAYLLQKAHGYDALNYLSLVEEYEFFFGSQVQGYIAYLRKGRKAMSLGDPVCEIEDRKPLIEEYLRFCEGQCLKPIFIAVSSDTMYIMQELGLSVMKCGEEAVLDLSDYTLAGGTRAVLRRSVNKGDKSGVTLQEYCPQKKRDFALETEIMELSRKWYEDKERQINFAVGSIDFEHPYDRRFFITRDAEGTMLVRAIGASKRNISQVFNAETVIVGLLAGILGVGVSVLLTIPITSVIQNLLGASEISASLPVTAALLLILLSVAITVIAGWIPSRRAAKKDPVAALRTE